MNNVQIETESSSKIENENAAPTEEEIDDRKPAADTTTIIDVSKKPEILVEEQISKTAVKPEPDAVITPSSNDVPTVAKMNPVPELPPKKRYKEGPEDNTHKTSKSPTISSVSRLTKKKEMMIKKCLGVSILRSNSTQSSSSALVPITVEFNELDNENLSQNISEIFVARLSLDADDSSLKTTPLQKKGIIAYLGHCHKVTSDEIRLLGEQQTKSNDSQKQILALLVEIQKQAVSYAASSLMEPDIFMMGNVSTQQLAKCLTNAATDTSSPIVFGATGPKSSFYYSLCEELSSQDLPSFQKIMKDTVTYLIQSFHNKTDSVLDAGDGGILTITALKALCMHKKAAHALTLHEMFLLPKAGTPEANEKISNIPPGATSQQMQIFQMMQALNRGITGYLKRSGPALEKQTILGKVFKYGVPFDSQSVLSQFQNPAKKTIIQLNNTTSSIRRQLKMYQDESFALLKALIHAGPEAKDRVMTWIVDALLVNIGSTAMRPDRSKVSHSQTLLNIGVALMKLCEPFINDPKKSRLIDPRFVSSPDHHHNVYATTGDETVPRLSQNPATATSAYNPKNTFVPQLFFYTARILHLGLIPSSAFHTGLVRRVHHLAYSLRQRNSDESSNQDFNQALAMQYANEVSLLAPEMIADALRYFNLCAGFLNTIKNDQLSLMPEHLVDDTCALITFTSRFATKQMQGIDLGNIFRVTVKLLSPQYASIIRNYNLRAKLGDVLYDVFLPSNFEGNRSVPASVSCDPNAAGQPFLLSDKSAQETLAPSLLLLYGEVEHTGHYEQMSHRSHIASLLKYLWESKEHRSAFRRITQNKESFIKFANGIVNETNGLIASVIEKLPEIKRTQDQMKNPQQWTSLTEEQRETISSRHEENEQEVKRALPLCNKTLQMLGFLNSDADIRNLFLLEEMCGRLVNLLMNVLTKLVGSRGLEIKVDNPESYNFRPKEMLRDICSIFSTFSAAEEFQIACAKSAFYKPDLISKSAKTCRKHGLLVGESMDLFESLAGAVETAAKSIEDDDALTADAPDEYLDPLTYAFMTDPVILPTSNTIVDRSSIAQHLLNDPHDPFNRKELTMDMLVPATDLKKRMDEWLKKKRMASKGTED